MYLADLDGVGGWRMSLAEWRSCDEVLDWLGSLVALSSQGLVEGGPLPSQKCQVRQSMIRAATVRSSGWNER